MKPSLRQQHPRTYSEIVRFEHDRHAHRIAQLKRAEKMIRAVESDLSVLVESGKFYRIDEFSMCLEDCRWVGDHRAERAKWALRINTSGHLDSEAALITKLLSLGWSVEALDTSRSWGSVVIRKPSLRARVWLSAPSDFLKTLQPESITEEAAA